MAACTDSAVMPACPATPSCTAARATAWATRAEVVRRSSMGGRRGAPGAAGSVSSGTARAGEAIMWSGMRLAPGTSAPRPRPGVSPAPHRGGADTAAGPVSRPVTDFGRGPRVGDLKVAQAGHVVGEQAVAVQAPQSCPRRGGVQSLAGHGVTELVGDADACGTGAEDDDAVLGEHGLTGAGAGQH